MPSHSGPPSTLGATLRLIRAANHLDEIRRVTQQYRDDHPHPVRIFVAKDRAESESFAPTFDWSSSGTPPALDVAILVGEFSYNLRAALDYIVHQLAKLAGAGYRMRYFPIETKPLKWKERRKTWLEGIPDDHVEIVCRYQPFNGAHWLEVLKGINNSDKHEGLPVVISQFTGPLFISREQLVEVPGDDDRLELPQPDQTIEFLLTNDLPLEPTLHILLFEMSKLLDDFRPIFGDRQTFTVNDPGAVIGE